MLISNIPQIWEFIAYVRKEVNHYFNGEISDEVMESTVMSASELAENAIKFGVYVNDEKKQVSNLIWLIMKYTCK